MKRGTSMQFKHEKRPGTAVPTKTKPPAPKPEWDSNMTENPHKLSRAEVLQKKMSVMSANRQKAREEWQ